MKYYAGLIYGEKFNRYKITFLILFILSAAGIALGAIFADRLFLLFPSYSLMINGLFLGQDMSGEIFELCHMVNMVLMLSCFFSGITIYAPVICAICTILRGCFLGCTCQIVASCTNYGGIGILAQKLLLGGLETMALVIFASVTARVALRIFTEKPKAQSLFSGTLFNAGEFKRLFNYRFLLSYILFFILFCFILTALTAIDCLISKI